MKSLLILDKQNRWNPCARFSAQIPFYIIAFQFGLFYLGIRHFSCFLRQRGEPGSTVRNFMPALSHYFVAKLNRISFLIGFRV